jgi:hypothetical protein
MLQVIKCPSCSAPLEFSGDAAVETCHFCGSKVVMSPSDVHTEASFGFDALLGRAQQLKEILNLARSGNKIGAIKLYREMFNCGLADAKRAVEAMERGESVNFHNVNFQSCEPLTINTGATETPAKSRGLTVAAIFMIIAVFTAGLASFIIHSVTGTANSVKSTIPSPTPIQKSSPPANRLLPQKFPDSAETELSPVFLRIIEA